MSATTLSTPNTTAHAHTDAAIRVEYGALGLRRAAGKY